MNVFPGQSGANGYPGTNFGNACNPPYATNNNATTQLLASCPTIAAGIQKCQANGKKILLSLGGASPDNYIADDASAASFAEFLWNAFGPVPLSWNGPRPFGDAVVDGFDFDIESSASHMQVGPDNGYAAMVTRLRELFASDIGHTYYVSAAPQCVIPDAHLANAIQNSFFDFM